MHEAAEFAERVSVGPQSKQRLSDHQRNADDCHRLVSKGEVDDELLTYLLTYILETVIE